MAGNDQVSSQELASSLSSLGETTTAAELVRKQGQSKKLKVISEKKLMEWILSLLRQHMAGKADAFSDAEKEELLRKTQDELKRRMLREQAAESERARVQTEYESAVKVLNDAKLSQADYTKAMDALRAKLESAEASVNDLQQDNYDLQDQLQEKMALVSTTLAEKEKLRDTVRQQMVHSGDLIGGVLGVDNQYYGARHQEDNPVAEDSGQDEQFYHDFSTGAKVIQTLMHDLERLRSIAKRSLEEREAHDKDPRRNLLEGDLQLLEQLKEGNLQAMDVSQPVATLIEALDGARSEAEAMEETVSTVTGNSSQRTPFTAVPDADGAPAEVLAGATIVARELAAELSRSRQRVMALKQIADEAEMERSAGEDAIEKLTAEHGRLLTALADKAKADQLVIPQALADAQAPGAERDAAALMVIEQFQAGHPEADEALAEQLAVVDRLVGNPVDPVAATDHQQLAERMHKAGQDLEKLVLEQRRQLEQAEARERTLAQRINALADAQRPAEGKRSPDLQRSSDRLRAVLSGPERTTSLEAVEAAASVVAALQEQSQHEQAATTAQLQELTKALDQARSAHGASQNRILELEGFIATNGEQQRMVNAELERLRANQSSLIQVQNDLYAAQTQARIHAASGRAIAGHVLKAIKGDEQLADSGADLALVMDQGDEAQLPPEAFAKQLVDTVAALAARKLAIQREHDQLTATLNRTTAELNELKAHSQEVSQSHSAFASTLVDLARQDPDSDDTPHLAIALEETKEGASLPTSALERHVTGRLQNLTSRKQQLVTDNERLAAELMILKGQLVNHESRATALENERDEMAESGKEIISQLRQQKDAREKDVQALRAENELAAGKLSEFQDRMHQAEAANRRLAEALAAVATVEAKHDFADAPSIEDPRMDLEVALSQLPNEDDTDDVAQTGDLTAQIAASGHKLAEALQARREAVANAMANATTDNRRLRDQLERINAEFSRTRSTLEERDAIIRRNANEVTAIKREMTSQGAALAAQVQELSQSKSELASARADVDTVRSRLLDQETRLTETRTKLLQASHELERLTAEHAAMGARAEAAEQNQLAIAQSLRSLGSISGSALSDPIAKAAQKLELARHAGGDEVSAAGRAFVEAVRGHAQNLSQELSSTRSQLDKVHGESAALSDQLANHRAALVDRDMSLEDLHRQITAAAEEKSSLAATIAAREQDVAQARDRHAELEERLRQTEAELEDHKARGGASSAGLSEELTQLRDELAHEHQLRKQSEAQIHDLNERAEAGDARLKRQREEFSRRLEERDQLIQEKDRLLDEQGSKRVDIKGLEAQVTALSQQLAVANERVKDYETVHGAHAGATSKSGDLARDLKKAQADRDALREKQRQLESDLADAVSAHEELHTQLEEKRKEVAGARDEMAKEIGEERVKTNLLKEEFRKLKEEVIGLRARLRRLTDDKH